MKKFIFLTVVALATMQASFAQTKAVAKFKSVYNGTAIDTAVNTQIKNMDLKVTKPADVITIQAIATKISGTTAGVVRAWVSNDGINWTRFKEGASLAAGDSLNLANATGAQQIIFTDRPSRYLFYRVAISQAGTASTKFSAVAVSAK